MPCGVTRLLLPAIAVGLVVGGLANNTLVAWAAGALVAGLLYLRDVRRGGSFAAGNCAVQPPRRAERTEPDDSAAPQPFFSDATASSAARLETNGTRGGERSDGR